MARTVASDWSESFVLPTTQPRFGFQAASFVPLLTWLIFPVTLGLAITRQSLWTDEGFTVWFASHSSLHSFLRALIGSRGAPGDPQFILYLLHMWGWVKVFGPSELSLRAANIPFAVIFIYSVSWASRRLFWSRNLWVLFCLSPFFWFYLNEARPYVALLSFSSAACVALVAFLVEPERYGKTAPWFCLLALFLAWGTHILAVFLFPTLLILVITMARNDSRLRSDFFRYWARPAVWCAPAFLALGGFYLWVSSYGVNKMEGTPSLRNLAFALYEFAGFAGLGPPRNDIRQSPGLSVFLPYSPWLLFGAIPVAAVVVFVSQTRHSRIVRNILISVSSGLLIALGVSVFEHFQVLGRHLAVFFPLILMTAMIAPKHVRPSPGAHGNVAISLIALGLVWGISDLRLVLLTKYAKDSYRDACSIAVSRARQDGAVILWAADPVTAEYYGLTVTPRNGSILGTEPSRQVPLSAVGQAIAASSWSVEQTNVYFANSSVPTILVLGRADPFDSLGAWSARIREQGPAPIAHLNALSIFEWNPGTDANCSACSRPPSDELLVERSFESGFPHRLPSLPSAAAAR